MVGQTSDSLLKLFVAVVHGFELAAVDGAYGMGG
jgi:hypothetical protein